MREDTLSVGESKLIVFSGIDGSGKTTLAKKLLEHMTLKGFKAEYAWCRHESQAVFLLVGLIKGVSRKGTTNEAAEHGYASLKRRLFSNRLVRGLYVSYVTLDYMVQIHGAIRKKLARSDVVVVDRYLVDVAADVMVECSLSQANAQRFMRVLERLLPTPAFSFLVLVPEDVSMSRKNDIVGLDYLRKRLRAYYALTNSNMVKIDGTEPMDKILSGVLANLNGAFHAAASGGN